MEFQLLFQILKDDVVKVLHSICQQIWKTQQWPQDWKRSVYIPIPRKGNDKESSNYRTVALISHVSKVMLKILQAKSSTVCELNRELPDVWLCVSDHTIVVIWVMTIFLYSSSVYSCHLFLISSASLRFIPFLSFIEPIFVEMFPWYL